MAMTLRLSPDQTDALRRRALADQTSMQAVVHRALEDYLRAAEPEVPLEVLLDQEATRFAGAVEDLARWPD